MAISGRTKLYGVLGDPVDHSRSPFLMNRAFATLSIDAVYVALPVKAVGFAAALQGLRAVGLAGANVTYPHKERAARTCDRLSPRAAMLGAVNTLTVAPDGLRGENTDAPGAALALLTFDGPTEDKRVAVLGAGGAARAAALGLLEAGARRVTFLARRPAAASEAVGALMDHHPDDRVLVARDRGQAEQAMRAADLVIQATPVGMAGGGDPGFPPLIEAAWLHERLCCMDLVYHPLETPFLHAARTQGARCVNGLALLAAQACEALRIWTGQGFDLREMHAALERERET